MDVGYAAGVFDLFHIGHVNILRNARAMCDRLIVGVTVDELVAYKNKRAVIPFEERIEIVRACRHCDVAVPQETMDKMDAWQRYKFSVMFVGDDWYQHEKWKAFDKQFADVGVRVVYMPYTKSTSSTLINQTLAQLRNHTTLEAAA
jgi:glycerol-3-phosphate cytidylyltransferase